MIEDTTMSHLKILVNSPKHWEPLNKYLNELLTVECNRLIFADKLETIKEVQGSIKNIRRLLALPEEVRNRERRQSA